MARGSTLWFLFACIFVLTIANPKLKGKKGCKLKDGKILKEKQSQKSECFEYKCLKKRGEFYLKSKLRKNKCCKLEGSAVPNKWTSMTRGNLTSCISGKLQVERNPSKKVIRKEMEKSIFQELLQFDQLGVDIRSLEKSLPLVDLLIGEKRQKRKPSELLKREFENIIKKHNYTGYIYGIENIVNLIENNKLKNLIIYKINQLREKNGYRKLEFSKENRTTNHRVFSTSSFAKVGQIPFQARLEITSCKGDLICGGVLISPCFLLTAKHCIKDVADMQNDIKIIMGDLRAAWIFDDWQTQRLQVLFVHSHPSQDIAIIRLKRAAKLSYWNNEAVKTIKILPDPVDLYQEDTNYGYVSGWGLYNTLQTGQSDNLRYRRFTVPKWDTCKEPAKGNEDMICAKYACQGDSGGPLFYISAESGSKTKYLWGIISKGNEGRCDGSYIGCVDVANLGGTVNNWIKNIVLNRLNDDLGSESFDCPCHQSDCKQTYECPDDSESCFAASSTTVLHDGQIKPLPELMVGDKILAGNIQGKPIFSKFIGWLHKDERKEATFLKISSKMGCITLTPDHLILSKSQDYDRNMKYAFAKDIKIGDQVTMKFDNNTFTWAIVTQIQQQTETGVFAPLTEEGTVVVDGMLASTYAGVDHDLAHAAFSIVRCFPSLLEDSESQHINGIRTFPKVLITIARMLNLLEEDELKKEDKEKTYCTVLVFTLGVWIIVYIKKKI